jgi:hypothetical protein
MAQTDKWVTDLKKELDKKTAKDLEPTFVAPSGQSNLIDPTIAESQAMVAHFRTGKVPPEVIKLVKRGELTFSLEQINDALIAWQAVFAEKSK